MVMDRQAQPQHHQQPQQQSPQTVYPAQQQQQQPQQQPQAPYPPQAMAATNNEANAVNAAGLPSPQSVGREFVRQYYSLLSQAPLHLHRFYSHNSVFVHSGMGKDEKPVSHVNQDSVDHAERFLR